MTASRTRQTEPLHPPTPVTGRSALSWWRRSERGLAVTSALAIVAVIIVRTIDGVSLASPLGAVIMIGVVLLVVDGLWAGLQGIRASQREKQAGYSTLAGSSPIFGDAPRLWILDGETGRVLRPPKIGPDER
jgi:hypothetical protein